MMKFDKLKQRWERDRIRRQEDSALRQKLLREKARPVFKKFRISKVVLFGSAAENRSHPDSRSIRSPAAGRQLLGLHKRVGGYGRASR